MGPSLPPMVDVAQLVSAPDCGSGGRGFESHRPPLITYGTLAQLVEHLTFNQVVGGSIPPCLILKDDVNAYYSVFTFFIVHFP